MATSLLKTCCGKIETILGSNAVRILNEYVNEPQKTLNINSLNSLVYFITYTDINLNQALLFLNYNGNLLLNWVDKYNRDVEIEFEDTKLNCYSEECKSDFTIPLNKNAIRIFLHLH